jgi:aldose 1-epimerase
LDDKTFQLPINWGQHHLHGGFRGLDKVLWNAVPYKSESGSGVRFSYESHDGEEGYPGNISIQFQLSLHHDNSLRFIYSAETDKATPFNLTHHSYFNLGEDTILDHELQIRADQYLPLDQDLIPTGVIQSVSRSPFDLQEGKQIAAIVENLHPQILYAGGLDHCFVLKATPDPQPAAILSSPSSGRQLKLYTDMPGLQVYDGHGLNGMGRNQMILKPYAGIALEPQYFPDAVHHEHFPDAILQPGRSYHAASRVVFSTY